MTAISRFLSLVSLFLLAVPAYAIPSPSGLSDKKPECQEILWRNCSAFGVDSQDPNLTCGYHEVPMDYHDPSAGKARLAVAKYAATASKKLGTLFANPGGPGNSGVQIVAQLGQNVSAIFNGTYDLISWDPRGVGFTFPGAVTCFDSQAEEDAFFNNTIVRSINYTIAGRFDEQDQDELFSRTNKSSRLLLEFGKRCKQGPVGEFLQFVGTSSTVRDLVSLGDHIVGEGKPIDYWGFSYGTVIGMNFLNMFPERVGRVILDGVVDTTIWLSLKSPRATLADSEKTYSALTDACAASGRTGCRLVELVGENASGQDIKQLLNDAHDTALRLERAGFDQLPITTTDMRRALLFTLTTPLLWSNFANEEAFPLLVLIFQAAQALNIPYNETYQVPSETVNPSTSLFMLGTDKSGNNCAQNLTSYGREAIMGADDFVDVENHVVVKDIFDEIVNITQSVTPTFGAIWGLGYTFGWPVRSVERLPPFDFTKLEQLVLLIGNTADPLTPFGNAQAAAKLIGDRAVLVEQLGVGHVSLAQPSSCTLGIVANFVVNNQLPVVPSGGHIKCEVDPTNVLFPPIDNSTSAKRDISPLMRRRR